MPSRPNVIFCMCDELRAFEVGCYGHPGIRTPNIDALAASGVRFETAVSNNPVCMPARSIVLSGQYSRTCCGHLGNSVHKVVDGRGIMPQWPVAKWRQVKQPTVAHAFRDAGYRTAAIGKWHIEAWPDELGFDHYNIPAVQHAHSAQWFCENGGNLHAPQEYSVEYEIGRVSAYLEERAGDAKPFFLYYNISPPHMPLADAPERYREMYAPKDVITRPNVRESDLNDPVSQFLIYLWDYRFYRDNLPYTRTLPDGCDLRKIHAMYMGLTTWVDDTVGKLTAALRAKGLAENTIFVFTSDHGDNLGSFGRMGKATLNEESIRIPLCVSGPGVARGHASSRVASLVDMAPTMLELAGVPVPAHMQGRSVTANLRGEAPDPAENYALIETSGDGCGIRTPTHLLGLPWGASARDVGAAPHYFFDLTRDPYELENLAGREGNSPLARDLTARLRAWLDRTPWGTIGE